MRLENIKTAIALGWVTAACAAAFFVGVGSTSGWALFAIVTPLPPLAMYWLWHEPTQTLSESIDHARR